MSIIIGSGVLTGTKDGSKIKIGDAIWTGTFYKAWKTDKCTYLNKQLRWNGARLSV